MSDENTGPLDLVAPVPPPAGVPGLSVDVYFNADRLNMMMKLAKQYHAAKCFTSDVSNAEQALVKMQAGAEMGMGPSQAMAELYLVKGKVTIFGSGMTRRLRERGWTIEVLKEEENVCHVKVTKGEEEYEYEATAEEVGALKSTALGFAKKDKLFWHAISRIIRRYVPEILGGAVMYYTEEVQMGNFDEPTVEVVEGEEIPQDEEAAPEKEIAEKKEPVKKSFDRSTGKGGKSGASGPLSLD